MEFYYLKINMKYYLIGVLLFFLFDNSRWFYFITPIGDIVFFNNLFKAIIFPVILLIRKFNDWKNNLHKL